MARLRFVEPSDNVAQLSKLIALADGNPALLLSFRLSQEAFYKLDRFRMPWQYAVERIHNDVFRLPIQRNAIGFDDVI